MIHPRPVIWLMTFTAVLGLLTTAVALVIA